MEKILDNEVQKKNIRDNTRVKQFIGELQKSIENTKENCNKDEFYCEVYDELTLAPKYKDQLQSIINNSMLEYSYDNEFVYVNYDKVANKYYMNIYDGTLTKIKTSKKEIEESNLQTNTFYFPIRNWEYLVEKEYIKEHIKKIIEEKIENLEKISKRRKNE